MRKDKVSMDLFVSRVLCLKINLGNDILRG